MSTSPTPSPEPVPAEPISSRLVLDEKKKAKIIALAANGSSRRMAARYVGCAPSTITRTLARDSEFREKLAAAEQNADIDALRALRVAARKPRYWRAAAWLLEHRHPDDFALRKPDTYTAEEFAYCIGMVMETIVKDLPEENYQRAMKKIEELYEMSREDYLALPKESSKMPNLPKAPPETERRHEAEARELFDSEPDETDEDFEGDYKQIPSDSSTESPLVQHHSLAENPPPLPPLAVTLESPYTSGMPI